VFPKDYGRFIDKSGGQNIKLNFRTVYFVPFETELFWFGRNARFRNSEKMSKVHSTAVDLKCSHPLKKVCLSKVTRNLDP
jgi:hypothetical protein